MATHSSILAWKIPLDGGASWQAAVCWGCRVGHKLTDFHFKYMLHLSKGEIK